MRAASSPDYRPSPSPNVGARLALSITFATLALLVLAAILIGALDATSGQLDDQLLAPFRWLEGVPAA